MSLLQAPRLLLLGCVALFTLPANAGLVRYDVFFQPGTAGPAPAFDGYMLFSDQAALPGNIWSYLADWQFDFSQVGGPVIDPSNTLPWVDGYFNVDAAWNYVNDAEFNPRPPVLTGFPCFTTTGDCNNAGSSEPIVLSTLSFLSGAIVSYPGFNERAEPTFGGSVVYSGPTFVALPATVALFLPAVLILVLRQRHTRRRTTAHSSC